MSNDQKQPPLNKYIDKWGSSLTAEQRAELESISETDARLTLCRRILATAQKDGAHVLFATQSLSLFGRLLYDEFDRLGENDPRYDELNDAVTNFLRTQEQPLELELNALQRVWSALANEACQHEKMNEFLET
jgi:hypothetical protein